MRLLHRVILVATVALSAELAAAQAPTGPDVPPGSQGANPEGAPPTLRDRVLMARRMGRTAAEKEVAILTGMLGSPDLADEARMALERIPGEVSLAGLNSALATCQGDTLVGAINSLGRRHGLLGIDSPLGALAGESPEVLDAVIVALGRSGDVKTGWNLIKLERQVPPRHGDTFAHALLDCAWRSEEAGEGKEAATLYQLLVKEGRPRSVRLGAFLGLTRTSPGGKANIVFGKALSGSDPVLQEAALRYLAIAEERDALLVFAGGRLNHLSPDLQLRLLAQLTAADGLDVEGLAKLLESAESPTVKRIAWLASLDRIPLENLAVGATATSPDDLDPDHGGLDAPAAIDGDPSTYWDETDGQALYRLVVELPGPRAVSALSMSGFRHHDFAPKDFDVLLDGSLVRRVANSRYENNRLWVTLPPTTCTRIELRIDGYYGASPAIRELGVFDLGAWSAAPDLARPSGFEWAEGHEPELLRDDVTIWKLNLLPRAEKGYLYPVALPDGTPLTWLSPPDHVWHRSLWFSWKFINGVNYWEDVEGRGITEGGSLIAFQSRTDFSSNYGLELEYHPPDAEPVMREKRRISISAPDETKGYHVTWRTTFTALEADVVLDRTPPADEPDGQSWGGYAGMSVRLAKETRDWRIVDSEGRTGMECHRQPARWIRADFARTDTGREAGIAILDHPENLRHPTPSFIVLTPEIPFVYYSPAILFDGPLTLKAGTSFSLAYRILVHPGRATDEWIDGAWKRFAETPLLPNEDR